MSIANSIFKEASGYIILISLKPMAGLAHFLLHYWIILVRTFFGEQYLTRNVQALFTSMQIFNQLVYLFNPSNVFA